MSKRESITRYSLIIKKLRRQPATFEEIAGYLEQQSELEEYDYNISKRTFQRDLNDIREIYKIDIQYDRQRLCYYIDYDENPEINERILEAFDTFNALNMSDRLSGVIYFEKRKPQGTENLFGAMFALRNNYKVKFKYKSFWHEETSNRILEPYGLKEFKYRWYLIGKDFKDSKIKTFGLDRITDFEVSKSKFDNPDFDINEYFRNCFGIIGPNAPAPDIIQIWFSPTQGKFIKSLPLHESQHVISDNEAGLIIELTLYLTYDLVMELLSFGGEIKVLQPSQLIHLVKEAHEKGLSVYVNK